METTEYRKRLEYRTTLKVVRQSELASIVPVKELPDIRTVAQKKADELRKTKIPVDYRGYIKCKTHDFF